MYALLLKKLAKMFTKLAARQTCVHRQSIYPVSSSYWNLWLNKNQCLLIQRKFLTKQEKQIFKLEDWLSLKMHGSLPLPQISFWVSIALARTLFSCIVINQTKDLWVRSFSDHPEMHRMYAQQHKKACCS